MESGYSSIACNYSIQTITDYYGTIKTYAGDVRHDHLAAAVKSSKTLELVEQWGSGVPGIFRQAAAAKLPESVIEELAGRVRFTVFLPEILPLSREKARGSTNAGVESRPESNLAILIIRSLVDQPLGKIEIARAIGHQSISGELKKQIIWLFENQFIERTIPEKPNSRLQKYRLSPKGHDLLNSLKQR